MKEIWCDNSLPVLTANFHLSLFEMKQLYLSPLFWVLVTTRNLDKYHYHCTFHEELIFKPPCSDYNCWDAQLFDFERVMLPQIFNIFRNNVATGNCDGCVKTEIYRNMFFLNWHWRLEYEAQKLMVTLKCPVSAANREYTLSQDPQFDHTESYGDVFANSVRYEYAATSFPYPGSKKDAWYRFHEYKTNMSLNCFDDWDANRKFRRAVMNYMGCAAVFRNHVTGKTGVGVVVKDESVMYILCVFASPVTNYSGIIGAEKCDHAMCRNFTGLEQATLAADLDCLCAYENLKNAEIEIPCQVYIVVELLDRNFEPFQVPCEETSVPELWQKYINPTGLEEPIKNWTVTFKNGTNLMTEVYSSSVTTTASTTTATVTVAPAFEVAAKPVKPQVAMVQLKPKMIENAYESKFCFIVVLIYLVIVSVLFLTVSLILKFHVEQKYLAMVT